MQQYIQQYMDNRESRSKKGLRQVKVAMQILKDYAGKHVMMEDVDKTVCKGYMDYLLTEYQPQGKSISRFMVQNYYHVLNCALNAAVRADIIKVNPLNKLDNSEKIRRYYTCRYSKKLLNKCPSVERRPQKSMFSICLPDVYKCHPQTLGKGGGYRQAFYVSHRKS